MQLPPLSLYIHIPWCVKKCPYCDFNSHAQSEPLPVEEYVDALLDDLQQDAHWAQGRSIKSIFFGGGTPSLLPAQAIVRILHGVKSRVPVDTNAEITLECNPGRAEYNQFETLLHGGVNRLSFGAQSFDDLQLATLGRIHSSAEITQAVNKAKQAGFSNFNIDLMHSLPGQNKTDAIHDIESALALQPTHLSWYQLTIEENTAFYKSKPTLPGEDVQSDIYYAGLACLEQAGFQQYEISAYSHEGYKSKHNLNYWEFGDYLAIGAGAHGKITRTDKSDYFRYQKTRMPKDYLDKNKAYTAKKNIIAKPDRSLEFMMNALRLKEGVALERFTLRTGLANKEIEKELAVLYKKELIIQPTKRLQTTDTGFHYLNEVLEHFQ